MLSFIESFGILFLIVVLFSFIVKLLKQPIIVGYVISGLFFSLFIKESTATSEQIIILADLGITFLLFLMGLELDLKNLQYLGKDIFIVTILQSAIFLFIGFGISHLFGFDTMQSLYLAILFMFSSTLLVAKWLEDKKEISTLKGRMILGILVMQDVFAILIMTILNVFKEQSVAKLWLIPVHGIILIGIAIIFAKYILNFLLRFAVKHPELLFISSLGVCFFFAGIAPLLGYSTTIGAFVAGVTLANTNYKNEIYSRLKPLIIFFNMLFFVGLGFQMQVTNLSMNTITYIAIICILSLILKPLFIHLTLRLRGYDTKTSFTSGLNLSQLSEFGIIIIASGVLYNIIPKEMGTIAVISVILTMILSSYLIKYDSIIFSFFRKPLEFIGIFLNKSQVKELKIDLMDYNVIFFGYYELSQEMFSKLNTLGKKILVIENDPANIKLLKKENLPYVYGSVTNPYFLSRFDFTKVDLVVSSFIDVEDNKTIIKHIKHSNPKSVIIVTSKNVKNSLELYESGADYVIYLSYLNEQHVSVLLEDFTTDINKVLTKKIEDISKFKEIDKKRNDIKFNFDMNNFLDKNSGNNNK